MIGRTIWTIGYEKATVQSVVKVLCAAGVEVLADVRALPLSRRPGFSKSSLAAAMIEADIEYVHLRALGTPADGRAAARRNDHATLERIYANQLELPEAIAAGGRLAGIVAERNVALLCYERAAHGCHRTLLRKALFPEYTVVDLLPGSV